MSPVSRISITTFSTSQSMFSFILGSLLSCILFLVLFCVFPNMYVCFATIRIQIKILSTLIKWSDISPTDLILLIKFVILCMYARHFLIALKYYNYWKILEYSKNSHPWHQREKIYLRGWRTTQRNLVNFPCCNRKGMFVSCIAPPQGLYQHGCWLSSTYHVFLPLLLLHF